jgi:hypothetical protein
MNSIERVRTWDDNWLLLRQLWPEWDPTDEQIGELWCRSFDKPHGVSGAGLVNQVALHEAILACKRSSNWREPSFLSVADAYRREKNRVLAELDRARTHSKEVDEKKIIEREHIERIRRIDTWSTERLMHAMNLVAKRFPTLKNKSLNKSAWSVTYSGLLIAADEELGGD